MYLIDTVVLSELRKPQRDVRLAAWIARQRTTDLFVSVVTIGEIERGIARQRATDPNFAAALGFFAVTHVIDYVNAWADLPEQSLKTALEAAERAVVIGPH